MATAHVRLMQELNDRIYAVLRDAGFEDGDFVCECDDPDCIETVQLTLREYAALQADRNGRFLHAPGHARAEVWSPT